VSEIRVERSEAAAIVYEVLAHVDLGPDAASLFDPRRPARAWARPLRDAYDRAPGRLFVHAIGLKTASTEALVHALREGTPGLADHDGRALGAAIADAIEDLRAEFRARFLADAEGFERRRDAFLREAAPVLARLRAALVETTGAPPPPLRVLDCPALGGNGRATAIAGERVVAVSLAMPHPHPLLQVLHEEIHPITDPVFATEQPRARDTRAGTPGHAMHRALELAAIEVGDALVSARAPELAEAYRAWRARLRI
jgi:hypothetical protein